MAQEVKIGDLYTFDDNTTGVVFYVDEDGHGLAVSLNQEKRRSAMVIPTCSRLRSRLLFKMLRATMFMYCAVMFCATIPTGLTSVWLSAMYS